MCFFALCTGRTDRTGAVPACGETNSGHLFCAFAKQHARFSLCPLSQADCLCHFTSGGVVSLLTRDRAAQAACGTSLPSHTIDHHAVVAFRLTSLGCFGGSSRSQRRERGAFHPIPSTPNPGHGLCGKDDLSPYIQLSSIHRDFPVSILFIA